MNVGWPYLQDCHLTHRITELTKADQRKPLALLEKMILMACQNDRGCGNPQTQVSKKNNGPHLK